MGFIKEVDVYCKNGTRVYIHQCHSKGRQTRVFAIRKTDRTGLAQYLGQIAWTRGWRQYVFYPANDTFWNTTCMSKIIEFLNKINRDEKRRKHAAS